MIQQGRDHEGYGQNPIGMRIPRFLAEQQDRMNAFQHSFRTVQGGFATSRWRIQVRSRIVQPFRRKTRSGCRADGTMSHRFHHVSVRYRRKRHSVRCARKYRVLLQAGIRCDKRLRVATDPTGYRERTGSVGFRSQFRSEPVGTAIRRYAGSARGNGRNSEDGTGKNSGRRNANTDGIRFQAGFRCGFFR